MAGGPVRIDVRQLRPGLYVSLGERWLDHNFLFNSFRLSSDAQVAKVRSMGVTHVDYWPDRSTTTPLPLPATPAAPPAAARGDAQHAAAAAELAERRARIERVAARRAALARCERAYRRSVVAVKSVLAEVFVAPQQAGEKADALVDEIVGDLLANPQMVIHLMSDGPADIGARYHSLNVMILSLLLGRAAGLPPPTLKAVGLGALLHDLGKVQVPPAVLRLESDQRNRHEEAAYRAHVDYGWSMCGELGIDEPVVVDIVRHHHERLDGNGFPDGLVGDAVSVPVRIVAIANRYDGLCHPVDRSRALSPSEALARMYRHEAGSFDAGLLQRFVKCLGVWPPGTVVQLSNGAVGLVTTVEPSETLRPTVLVADLSVPRAEALIVDLREASDVRVTRALRPDEVEPETLAYLSPRTRLNWFVGEDVPAR